MLYFLVDHDGHISDVAGVYVIVKVVVVIINIWNTKMVETRITIRYNSLNALEKLSGINEPSSGSYYMHVDHLSRAQ